MMCPDAGLVKETEALVIEVPSGLLAIADEVIE
jgi:hypothetical protein